MMSQAESRYAETMKAGSISFELSEYHQRRCERAQRRYLAAIKSLAQVRRLIIPMVQVNIARQQHITQTAGTTGTAEHESEPLPDGSEDPDIEGNGLE